MKFASVALLLVVVVVTLADDTHYDLKNASELFEKFVKDYNKHYKDEKDKEIHFEAFKKNVEEINKSNVENPSVHFEINSWSDETPDERKLHYGLLTTPNPKQ